MSVTGICLGVLLLILIITCSSIIQNDKLRPIRIGLSIDDHSLKDLVLLINSVIESALEPSELVFHIVACGKDNMAAMVLKESIAASLSDCLTDIKHELVAFVLPAASGFAQQLAQLKKKSNHWNSQSGADMVRFFLPSIFPHIDRLLYLDNDIIVSCCLEEVWDTPFEKHQIVGIALDDLNWATVTQFKRHYNASHPLVIKNMRRNLPAEEQSSRATETVSTKEFSAALPRYPNDGVLLIDVKRYNENKILDVVNEIAMANAGGEYCVNLGTQQFTVLALYDRWKELTPRANMRHFPDMARGYLMWFYYNGFIHYAGQHKPRLLCQTTTAENAQGRIPYLRVMSYTAWALSNYQVHKRCPNDRLAYVAECLPHVLEVHRLSDLYAVLHRITSVSPDPSLLYIHIGALHGDLSQEAYQKSSAYNKPYYLGNSSATADTSASPAQPIFASSSKTITDQNQEEDLIQVLSQIMLHNSSWSLRAFDYKTSRVEQSAQLLQSAGFQILSPEAAAAEKNRKKGKKEAVKRTLSVRLKHFCDSEHSPYKDTNSSHPENAALKNNTVAAAASASSGCESVLLEIKAEGRAHWDAQTIIVDVTPPQSFVPVKLQSSTSIHDDAGNTAVSISKHSSLGALLHLDLVFMRPKLIVVRLAASSASKLHRDTSTALRFLRQNGYLPAEYASAECGVSRTTMLHPHYHMHDISGSSSSDSGSSSTGSSSSSSNKLSTGFVPVTVHFNCVWGLRINEFEFFPNLLV